jgi:hypothetical protein
MRNPPEHTSAGGGSKVKIVVFGATGMVGSRIAAELESGGHARERVTAAW